MQKATPAVRPVSQIGCSLCHNADADSLSGINGPETDSDTFGHFVLLGILKLPN